MRMNISFKFKLFNDANEFLPSDISSSTDERSQNNFPQESKEGESPLLQVVLKYTLK